MTNSELTLVLGGTGKTGRRVAARLRALDRPVRIGSRAAGAVGAGVPAELTAPLGELFGTVLDGRNAEPAGGVAEALGRPPRDFAAFAATAWGSR